MLLAIRAEKPFTILWAFALRRSHCVYRVFRTNCVSTRFDVSPPCVTPTYSVNACAAGYSCIISYHIFTFIWDWQYPELMDQYHRGPRSSASAFLVPCRKRINTTVLIILWWTFGGIESNSVRLYNNNWFIFWGNMKSPFAIIHRHRHELVEIIPRNTISRCAWSIKQLLSLRYMESCHNQPWLWPRIFRLSINRGVMPTTLNKYP